MLTTKMLTDAERVLGEGAIVAIAFADFGNGYGLVYGLAQREDDGFFVPFSQRVGRQDLRTWDDMADTDMGIEPMLKLIDRLMNTNNDPHS